MCVAFATNLDLGNIINRLERDLMRYCGVGSLPDTNCVADSQAREYDSSWPASQKRRKIWMRRAMIDRYKPVYETGARLVFRLP